MLHNEMSANQLTDDLRKQLKWKLSNITPAIVKRCARWTILKGKINLSTLFVYHTIYDIIHPFVELFDLMAFLSSATLGSDLWEKPALTGGNLYSKHYFLVNQTKQVNNAINIIHIYVHSATWGKHMKPPAFKEIKETQKINHFPGKTVYLYHAEPSFVLFYHDHV